MGDESRHPVLAEILASVRKPPRSARLAEIQERIQSLRPQADEAHDVLDSLGAALRLNYDDCTEALLYLSLAQQALERLDLGQQV